MPDKRRLTINETNALIGEFLHDHPEHIAGVRQDEGGPRLDTDALIAFTDWSIEQATNNPDAAYTIDLDKAKRYREQLRKEYGR